MTSITQLTLTIHHSVWMQLLSPDQPFWFCWLGGGLDTFFVYSNTIQGERRRGIWSGGSLATAGSTAALLLVLSWAEGGCKGGHDPRAPSLILLWQNQSSKSQPGRNTATKQKNRKRMEKLSWVSNSDRSLVAAAELCTSVFYLYK